MNPVRQPKTYRLKKEDLPIIAEIVGKYSIPPNVISVGDAVSIALKAWQEQEQAAREAAKEAKNV